MIDLSTSSMHHRRRLRVVRDRLATLLISACGIGVVGAVLAIGIFLAVEVVPLFASPGVNESPVTARDIPRSADLQRTWLRTVPPSALVPHTEETFAEMGTRPMAVSEEILWQADGRELEVFSLEEGEPRLLGRITAVEEGRQITALASLVGGQALIVGDDEGGVRRWVMGSGGSALPVPTRPYRQAGEAAIRVLMPVPDQRLFLALDAAGELALYQALTGLRWTGPAPSGEPLGFDAESRLLWAGEAGIEQLSIDAKHAEVSWGSLWRPQHYEGHSEPQHRWQASVTQPADEPKFGMAPLAWGTLKAAAYALLFAIPLALGAAIHSACFMSRQLRHRLKPTIEMMEAMPGVVIGFIAGLVLAPYVERHLAGVFSLLLVLPLGMLFGGWCWSLLSPSLRQRLPIGWAGLWLMPWVAVLIATSLALSPTLERLFFGGDLRLWLEQTLGLDYANRNAMIVGLAMGFAVIPTIYALSEDALSGVPASLGEGAQALGATRWQTLWKVLLPAASPGIFSAVMIGAGRAVGETMIVLMATGNTAVMTWSPLEGMRSMAANIAIELPEASVGGTHYRLLLLSALLLFVFTFCVNTVAELVRERLKHRYRRLEGRS